MRSHLLNDTTAERYRRTVTEGVERVAAKLATTDRPFTGVTVDALSAVNSSLDTWDQSAGGTLIERKPIDWTNERIGFGLSADGVFTSGGSHTN